MSQEKNKYIPLGAAAVTLLGAFVFYFYFASPWQMRSADRHPDAVSANSLSAETLAKAEWSVSVQDFQNSNPRGRSYFDYVFSKTDQGKRVYDLPYPFQRVLDRVTSYLGYSVGDRDSSPLLRVLFPMGRSLQRNAALIDQAGYDENLFYRFPRVVVGVEQENKNPLALNLKGRLYMGFHEKSGVIEAISYNDEEGRFEYQVVRDYQDGKKPKVFYANRQLCLSCHQNQTPIFSEGPWNESNAHENVFQKIEANMLKDLKDQPCDDKNPKAFCFVGNGESKKYYYYGVPTRVDLTVPYSFDNLTDLGNYFHALQKTWLNLCTSQDCQHWVLKSVIRFVLTGQEGIFDEGGHAERLQAFEKAFQQKFPAGMKLPSPNIPNRDPQRDKNLSQAEIEVQKQFADKNKDTQKSLQELLKQNAVAGEFEPLMPRAPLEVWDNTEIDPKLSNRMIRGFAEFFSKTDVLLLDRWLAGKSEGMTPEVYHSTCNVRPSGDNAFSVACPPAEKNRVLLQDARVVIQNGEVTSESSMDTMLFLAPKADGTLCNYRVAQTIQNKTSGAACPTLSGGSLRGHLQGDVLTVIPFRSDGLRQRWMRGNLVRQIQLNIKTGSLDVAVVKDIDKLMDLVDKMQFLDPVTKQPAMLPWSRKLVMASVAKAFNIPELNLDEDQKIETLEKNLDEDEKSEGQIQAEIKNPLDGMMQSCGMCHYNFEGVPPAFIGLKQSTISDGQKCERLRTCAPRILYRIKMRNCSPEKIAKFKKNPMPLPVFFQRAKVDQQWWQKNISPQLVGYIKELIQPDQLARDLMAQGVSQEIARKSASELVNSSCPDVDYNIYESLPRCQFPDGQEVSAQCNELIKKWPH